MPFIASRPSSVPCDASCATASFYRERHQRYNPRRHLEPKPGSPLCPEASSPHPDPSQFSQSMGQPSSALTSDGALLSTIRSLSRRGRFPINNDFLPLSTTNEMTHYVNFRMSDLTTNNDVALSSLTLLSSAYSEYRRRVKVTMLCFKSKGDRTPICEVPLTGAIMVARTCSGSGPCIYIAASIGTFEFQCPHFGQYDYAFWESQMRHLGVKVLLPQDLFATAANDLIGEGSFAQVYLATHKATGRDVVIKRVPKEKLASLPQDHPSAVHIEIDVLSRIHHPYIVQFQTAFEDDRYYFIVLERLMGGNVYEWLRTHKFYNESDARGTMFRVLSALAALESEGIVHRDLKLENLVLEYPGDPTSIKLIDFGLAAFLDTPRMSMHCGSPGFVAPEIIAKKSSYGCRADVFSAGVILYCILSGKFPFHSDGDTASRTLTKNERCQISLDTTHWKSVSSNAKDLLVKLMSKDPTSRLTAGQALNHPWIVGGIPLLPLSPSHDQNHQAFPGILIASFPQHQQQLYQDGRDSPSCDSVWYPNSLSPLQYPVVSHHGDSNVIVPSTSGVFLPCCSPSTQSQHHAVITRLALIGNPFIVNPIPVLPAGPTHSQRHQHLGVSASLQQQRNLAAATETKNSSDENNNHINSMMATQEKPGLHCCWNSTSSRSRSTSHTSGHSFLSGLVVRGPAENVIVDTADFQKYSGTQFTEESKWIRDSDHVTAATRSQTHLPEESTRLQFVSDPVHRRVREIRDGHEQHPAYLLQPCLPSTTVASHNQLDTSRLCVPLVVVGFPYHQVGFPYHQVGFPYHQVGFPQDAIASQRRTPRGSLDKTSPNHSTLCHQTGLAESLVSPRFLRQPIHRRQALEPSV